MIKLFEGVLNWGREDWCKWSKEDWEKVAKYIGGVKTPL